MILSIRVAKAITSIAMPMTRFAVSFFRSTTPFCALDFGRAEERLGNIVERLASSTRPVDLARPHP